MLDYAIVWAGGEGLTSYQGPSSLAAQTFPASIDAEDFKDLRGVSQAVARKIQDQLAAGVSERYIRRTLGVSRADVRKVRLAE